MSAGPAYNTVLNSPIIPIVSAASESPAISPPPTSDVVLMSDEISPSPVAVSRPARLSLIVSQIELTTPPAANHALVISSTNPPNDDA